MKKLTLITTVLLFLGWSQAFAEKGVQFNHIKDQAAYEEAVEQAKKEGKTVLLDFYTDWCGWCKKMDKDTFALENVGEYMNQHFVSIKLDAEQEFGAQMAEKYEVEGFPTFVVVDPQSMKSNTIVGYQPPAMWLEKLKAQRKG
jgi:thioredoxin-related protein